MSNSYFTQWFGAKDEQTNLAVVPSSRHTKWVHKKLMSADNQISVFGPETEKNYYTPEERAAFLYKALTAKGEDGKFLYKNIIIPGGNGTDDTIFALEKYLKENALSLPKRTDLNILGFSDASQLFHYLGQRGVGNGFYFSGLVSEEKSDQGENVFDPKKLFKAIWEIKEKQEKNTPLEMDLQVINNPQNVKKLTGYTQPGSITHIELHQTHQLQLFPEGSNMLIVEPSGPTEIKRTKEILDQIKDVEHPEKIVLVLSKDTPKNLLGMIKEEFKDYPILFGANVGHNTCLFDGKPITLMAENRVDIERDKAKWIIAPVAGNKAEELSAQPKRTHQVKQGPDATTELVALKSWGGPGRCSVAAATDVDENGWPTKKENGIHEIDLTKIKQNQKKYTIQLDIPPDYVKGQKLGLWQRVELCLKELRGHGIIGKNLEQTNFKWIYVEKPHPFTAQAMQELKRLYFPNLKSITYNGQELLTDTQKVQTATAKEPSDSKSEVSCMLKKNKKKASQLDVAVQKHLNSKSNG